MESVIASRMGAVSTGRVTRPLGGRRLPSLRHLLGASGTKAAGASARGAAALGARRSARAVPILSGLPGRPPMARTEALVGAGFSASGLPPRPSARSPAPARAAASVATEGASAAPASAYPFADIEKKWQAYWEDNETFRMPDDVDMTKPKYYALDMFPYPSGAGLHVGHPEGYTATDIMSRYKRMRGYNVLHPMGWDAFGLPAEQYALQTGTHPAVTTAKNIGRFKEQLKSIGFSYDWDREVSTTDPDYYRWTQWIFLQLLERDLAYQAEVPVNWCPELGTVLANEEVIDGLSERGGHPVIRVAMRQWMLRITAYADRLIEDLDDVDWPESIKDMQRNWIGRSQGAEVSFKLTSCEGELDVYTTRPDTLFGATYMVVAPEHPMLLDIVGDEQRAEVEAYVEAASRKSDLERTELAKEKSGVFTGATARNPLTGENIPVWVADYVLGGYGSGAIMAVPAHDDRDHEFAEKFGLPIVQVVDSAGEPLPFTGDGKLINSSCEGLSLDGMAVDESKAAAIDFLEKEKIGAAKTNYKLRDWLFARQRYWGEPFPVVFEEGKPDVPIPVPIEDLPVVLPETDSYKPAGTGESPLAAIDDWVNTVVPGTDRPARRETNTMPQWAGSCWYYLRFADPKCKDFLIDPAKEKYWMDGGVDLYVGGAEHSVLHLLYARFWHKVLYDIGVVSTKEPFGKLVNQGMILGEVEYTGYKDSKGAWVSAEKAKDMDGVEEVRVDAADVEKTKGDLVVLASDPTVRVSARAHKMSKSRGNVINPDDVVDEYGADSLRLYEMFMGPLRDVKVWNTRGLDGMSRFLGRAWRLFDSTTEDEPTKEQLKTLHACIAKVTDDTEGMRFNTAISAMMEFTNAATKWEARPVSVLREFSLLLQPYAPHISEEMGARLGGDGTMAYQAWPELDESLLVEDSVKLACQVNGKMRGLLEVPVGATEDDVMEMARGNEGVAKFIGGKEVKKVIYKEGKILNIIVPK